MGLSLAIFSNRYRLWNVEIIVRSLNVKVKTSGKHNTIHVILIVL